MNIAYKHLDSKLRISEFTVAQWIGLFVALMAAILYANYLSPFGTTMTLATAIYVGGLPASVIIVANVTELDLWLLVRSAIRWYRVDHRYTPGPGSRTAGYTLIEPFDDAVSAEREQVVELDLASLWGEQ